MLRTRPILPAGIAALTLAGCIPQAAPPESPAQARPPSMADPAGDECGAARLDPYVNQLPTGDAMAGIRAAVGERTIRTIRPGDAVTMDYAPNRLNIELGEDGRIKRFRCG